MKVSDFEKTQNVHTPDEVKNFLGRRYEIDGASVNSFWMSSDQGYPAMGLLIRDNLARIDYMPDGEHAGYCSTGNISRLVKGEMTMFFFHGQKQPVLNDSIVSADDAFRVAEEFFHSKNLPKLIEWTEL